MVGKAVEQSAGEAQAAEDLRPFVEGLVAGDERRAALVALREDFEEEFGTSLGQRDESEFVDDEDLDLGERFLVAQEALLGAGFDQGVGQGGGNYHVTADLGV